MRRRTVVTTGDVAEHCQVSYETVKNWIRHGQLPAFETPGGHHRVLIEDFKTFLASYGMPDYDHEAEPVVQASSGNKRRVLIVDPDSGLVSILVDFCTDVEGYECASAVDGFEAGMLMVSFRPDLVILDILAPQLNGFQVCRTIKTNPNTRGALVLAVTGHPEDGNMSNIYACGADDGLVKPFKLEALKEHMDKLFATRPHAGSVQSASARR